jgi:hypothetical protein
LGVIRFRGHFFQRADWATRRGHDQIVRLLKRFEEAGSLPPPPSNELALADAQLLVARMHGFESCPQLVKHIED